ncbi:phage tail tape measure protein [Staphylococcus sp. HMSC056G08]|uniref:phage tail tape measure protein n=1 Tax=Staphylococcus sp. HMSC056G08 TaxID=1739350 RepID=UPI001C408806|nr:phage tail tape measure protein [Staphylococcus sp. HMSC056G08]
MKKAQTQRRRTNDQKEKAYEKLKKLRQAERELKDSNQATTAQLKKASEATKNQVQRHSELVAKYKKEDEQIKKLKSENEKLSTSNQKIKDSYEKTNTELNQTEKELKQLNDTIQNNEKYLANAEKAVNNERAAVNNLQKSIDKTKQEMKAFNKEQLIANSQYTKAAQHFDKMSERYQRFGNGMSAFGRNMSMYVTTPIVGAMGYASKLGVEFDDSMRKVQAISGATGQDLEALKAKAREMGATTKFSASDSAEALNYMAMSGWKSQDMIKGLPGIMDLAAASGEELGQVSDIVTDGLTAFGLKAKDSGHFADVLAAASANANTNVQMMGEGFKYAAPVAGALGYSIEDTSIAIGLMSNAGIKGEKAGTALRTMFTNLAKPTKAMKNQMDELGISITDSNGKMLPMRDVLDQLRDRFSGLSKDQQASAAATIFGKEAMSGALAVINASEEDYAKLSKAIDNSEGSAKKMANTMEKGLGGSLRELRSASEELAISLFESIQPALSGMVSGLKHVVDFLNKMPKGAKVAMAGVLGLTAVIGPLTLGIGLLLRTVGSAAKGYAMLNRQMAINTTEATLNGIANKGAAASLATSGKTIKGTSGFFGMFGNVLTNTTGKFGGLGKTALKSTKLIGRATIPLTILTTIFDVAYEKVDWFRKGFDDMGKLVNQVGESIDFSWIDKAKDKMSSYWDYLKNDMAKGLQEGLLFKGIKKAFDGLDGLVSKASDTTDVFSEKVSKGTKKALKSYISMSENARVKLEEIRINHETIGEKQYNQIKELYENINTEIDKQLAKRHKNEIEGLEKIFSETNGLSKEQEAKILEQTRQSNSKEAAEAHKINQQIHDITAAAYAEKRELTKSEHAKIAKLQDQLDKTVVKSLSKGEVEQKAILERMKQNKSKLSIEAASNVIKESAKERDKTISDAKKKYKDTVAEAIRQRDETGNLSKDEADKVIRNAKKQYEESKDKAKKQHNAVVGEAKKQNKGVSSNIDEQTGNVKTGWQKMLDTVKKKNDEIVKDTNKWNKVANKITGSSKKAHDGMNKWFGQVYNRAKNWFGKTKKAADKDWNSISSKLGSASRKGYNAVTKWFGQLPGKTSNWFKSTKKSTDDNWNKISNKISSSTRKAYNSAKKWFGSTYNNAKSNFKNTLNTTKDRFGSIARNVESKTHSVYNSAKKWFGSTYNNAKSNFKNMWNNAKSRYHEIASKAEEKSKSVYNSGKKWFGNTYTNAKSNFQNMKNKAKDRFHEIAGQAEEKAKKTYNSWKSWLDKTLGWIKNIKKDFGKAASELGKSVANKAVDGLNGMIGGINKISKAITDKTLIKPIPKLSTGTYDGSSLATDKNGGVLSPTMALVNDKGPGNGSGSNGHQELIQRADGSLHAPQGKDVVVQLNKGDGVINGATTQYMKRMGMIPKFSQGTIPRFSRGSKNKLDELLEYGKEKLGEVAKGLGSTTNTVRKTTKKSANKVKVEAHQITGAITEKIKDGAGWLGEKIGDVWDYMDNPGKLVAKVMDSLGITFGKGANATVEMAKGAYSILKKKLVDKVKSWFEEFGGADGSVFSGWRVMQPFSAPPKPPNPNYPFNGGVHYGVDYDIPENTPVRTPMGGRIRNWFDNGGGGNTVTVSKNGTYLWFMHLNKQLRKNGETVKAGDLIAKSGNTGSMTNYRHLHFQVMKGSESNSAAIDPEPWLAKNGAGAGAPGGSGYNNARKAILKAQSILGGRYRAGWITNEMLRVAQRESNYTSNAINNWDSNARAGTPSKGMFQMIDPSFRAYAKAGFSNPLNPTHQAISAMRYIVGKWVPIMGSWRAAFKRAGDYAYENGGLSTTHKLAQISEGNKAEMVVPLTKRTRAIQLIEQAMRYIGMETGSTNVTVNNDNSTIEKILSQLVRVSDYNNKLTQTIIKLLSNSKQGSPKDAANIISQILGEDMRMASFNQGG